MKNAASGLDWGAHIVQPMKRFTDRLSTMGTAGLGDAQPTQVPPLDAASQARVDVMLDQHIELQKEPLLKVNGFPFTAHKSTTMDQLYVLFEMVKANTVFVVTENRKLEGMISKDHLMFTLKGTKHN